MLSQETKTNLPSGTNDTTGQDSIAPAVHPELQKQSVNLTPIITTSIAALSFIFTVFSYLSGQNNMDRRKYNNAFYDERYRVMKEITKAISDIDNIIVYTEKINDDQVKDIRDKSSVFNYANLVLSTNGRDSELKVMLTTYENLMEDALTSTNPKTLQKMGEKGTEAINKCGQILINEKDSINSSNFSILGR